MPTIERNRTTGGHDKVYRMGGTVVARTPAKQVECTACKGRGYSIKWCDLGRGGLDECDECQDGKVWVEA